MSERDTMLMLSASERACYKWPGEDQQNLRAAYIEGAADYAAPLQAQEPVADIIARIAANNSADPATADLTVPLVIELAEALAELSRLRSHPPAAPSDDGWRDIASAPKDGTILDLWVVVSGAEDGEPTGPRRWPNSHWDAEIEAWRNMEGYCTESYVAVMTPTHWQPLPTPPTKGGTDAP